MWITLWKTQGKISGYPIVQASMEDIHYFILHFLITFPPFFAEKRYKLSNFAPEIEIVDKLPSSHKVSKLVSTSSVNIALSQSYNLTDKEIMRKFPTYERHIILFHFYL